MKANLIHIFTMHIIIETQKEAKKNPIKPKFSFSCFKGKFKGNHPQVQPIQIITSVVFCVLLLFIVIVLAIFVHDHTRKFMVSEDYYFLPPHPNFPCSVASSPNTFNAMSSFEHLGNDDGFGSYVAPKKLWHSMSDEELLWRASMVPRVSKYPFRRMPKVAFMFLARGRLLTPLWERFFKGYERLFSIYVHTSTDYKDGDEPPQSSVFHKRSIPSKPFEWEKATVMDAERRLLANALLDFSNERFILVSESCIPLFNFSTIYNYLSIYNHSHSSSYDDPTRVRRGRSSKRVSPTISLFECRKGFQWFEVERRLAIEIVSDTIYFPTLKEHCQLSCYVDDNYLTNLARKVATD